MKAMILAHLAIGIFCLGLTMSVHNNVTAGEDRFPGFTVGVQSYCFRNFDLDGALKNTQELGLKNIEFYSKHASHDMTAEQLENVKKKLKAAGIKMVAYGVVGFGANAEANEKIFKFAKEMGIKVITADPSPDSFDSLEKLVKKYDVKIAIHNHGPALDTPLWRMCSMRSKGVIGESGCALTTAIFSGRAWILLKLW